MMPKVRYWLLVCLAFAVLGGVLTALIYLIAPGYDWRPMWIGIIISMILVGRRFQSVFVSDRDKA